MKRVLVVGAAAALSLTALPAVTPEPVEAAFPGTNGLIAYADDGIRVVNPDGSGMTRVTYDASDHGPAWSPDGKKIAFSRGCDIWVMNADGTDQTIVVTSDQGCDYSPAWSPDGRKLAYVSYGPCGDSVCSATSHGEIWRANYPPDGDAVRITHTPQFYRGARHASEPSWSPRGDWIAFTQRMVWEDYYEDAYSIWRVRPDGTSLTRVVGAGTPDAQHPDWNPAGTRLVFSSGGIFDVWVGPFNLKTINPFDPPDNVRNVTDPGYEDRYYQPAWSPDGRWLVAFFEDWSSESGSGLYVLRSDGSGTPIKIVDNFNYSFAPDWQPVPRPVGPDCTITGTPGPDVIVGTWRDDVICGLAGNDVIRGKGGNDTIYGHQGADIVYGGNGNDHILGGAGNDRLAGEAGNDTVDGGKGKDKLFGNADNDTLLAQDFWKDTVYGGPGHDTATIDHGKDTVYSVETIR